MKALERPDALSKGPMGHFVRPMVMEDIRQVADVEKECFPTGWTTTPFKRELRNRMTAYLVACEAVDASDAEYEARLPFLTHALQPSPSGLGRFIVRLKALFQPSPPPSGPPQLVIGYVGLWFIADEAHITAIGVRESHRRYGIGELLLLASVEVAIPQQSRVMSLEVRASNHGAQALYEKYGFRREGLRKGYYTDNHEDAVIMTTESINEPAYAQRLAELRRRHAQHWGPSVRYLGQR